MNQKNLSTILSDFYTTVNCNDNYTKFKNLLDNLNMFSNLNETHDPILEFNNMKNKVYSYFNNPFGLSILLLLSMISYIYFANNMMYYLIALIIPSYYAYTMLLDDNNNMDNYINIIVYFIIFSHVEVIFYLLSIIMMGIHLKIATIVFLNYVLFYNQNMLQYIYSNTIYSDQIILTFINLMIIKLSNELVSISNNVKKINFETKSKKQL
ncbi:hypothetical protein [Megavirus chiliensis]|uniref:Uncharacterized protein n=3 Tax=Megamimivirinae TaxID=3044648 RepID=A0A2L2DN17_MIMIV|nr:hypothetical protein MegaChil _gp0724 [Megavirus chiliensis]AEQ32432.1 hypothetical protein [Megavirus chiliensis]AGD92671.1 hypothetical protein LBA_00753 [Megavirus lba]AVG47559.1 hypothetical protein [Acanthamoeba polyphaga mimivirus]